LRPQVHADLAKGADWYEKQQPGLGREFVREVMAVLPRLAENPFANSRRHPLHHVRWRYPERFPYRIIYRVEEKSQVVTVIGVLHAKRHDRHWRRRM
jgi:toxin ParE1/3/4